MLDAGMDQQQKIPTIYHYSTHFIFWETNSMAKEHATEKQMWLMLYFYCLRKELKLYSKKKL